MFTSSCYDREKIYNVPFVNQPGWLESFAMGQRGRNIMVNNLRSLTKVGKKELFLRTLWMYNEVVLPRRWGKATHSVSDHNVFNVCVCVCVLEMIFEARVRRGKNSCSGCIHWVGDGWWGGCENLAKGVGSLYAEAMSFREEEKRQKRVEVQTRKAKSSSCVAGLNMAPKCIFGWRNQPWAAGAVLLGPCQGGSCHSCQVIP